MAKGERGAWLTVCAVGFAIMAFSNCLKPLVANERTGFVFFGERLSGRPTAILGRLFGLFLAVYAIGIWRMKRWALPMAWLYAGYVVVNLLLFRYRTPQDPAHSPGALFAIVYLIAAIGKSAGAGFT